MIWYIKNLSQLFRLRAVLRFHLSINSELGGIPGLLSITFKWIILSVWMFVSFRQTNLFAAKPSIYNRNKTIMLVFELCHIVWVALLSLVNCCMMRSISVQDSKTIAVENQILWKQFLESLLQVFVEKNEE